MGGEGVKRIMLLASVGLVALLVMAVQPTYSMLHVDLEVRKLEKWGGGDRLLGGLIPSSIRDDNIGHAGG